MVDGEWGAGRVTHDGMVSEQVYQPRSEALHSCVTRPQVFGKSYQRLDTETQPVSY